MHRRETQLRDWGVQESVPNVRRWRRYVLEIKQDATKYAVHPVSREAWLRWATVDSCGFSRKASRFFDHVKVCKEIERLYLIYPSFHFNVADQKIATSGILQEHSVDRTRTLAPSEYVCGFTAWSCIPLLVQFLSFVRLCVLSWFNLRVSGCLAYCSHHDVSQTDAHDALWKGAVFRVLCSCSCSVFGVCAWRSMLSLCFRLEHSWPACPWCPHPGMDDKAMK